MRHACWLLPLLLGSALALRRRKDPEEVAAEAAAEAPPEEPGVPSNAALIADDGTPVAPVEFLSEQVPAGASDAPPALVEESAAPAAPAAPADAAPAAADVASTTAQPAAPVKPKAKPPPPQPKGASSWDLYATPGSKKRSTMLIPKVLHQTYSGPLLPSRFAKYHATWKKYLPSDWARKLWTPEELRQLVKDHYSWFLETYDSFEQDINRIYAARVFLMHHYGGVYADLDVEVLKDPSPLFSGDYDLVFFYNKAPKFRRPWAIDHPAGNAMGTISNSMMASVSKHPFWLYLAQRMLKGAKEAASLREKMYTAGGWGYKFKDVMWTTGASLLTDSLADHQEKFPDTIVGIFSNKYWSPWRNDAKDELCEGPEACFVLHPDAFTVHHWTGSWNHCTPGTCLAKAEDRSKRKHKRVMPPPPPLPDEEGSAALPPVPTEDPAEQNAPAILPTDDPMVTPAPVEAAPETTPAEELS